MGYLMMDEPSRPSNVGREAPDGTICAGISPDAHGFMWTKSRDERLVYTFNEAREHATNLNMRVPSKNEFAVMFQNRAAIGGFREDNGWNPSGYYWSSSEAGPLYAWATSIYDGSQRLALKEENLSLRCVR